MVGKYGDIFQPLVVDSRFDYVLFTDHFDVDKIGVWQVKRIPETIHNDNKRLSRYPKTHLKGMLPDYEASLYIDANVQIRDQWVYDRFTELFNKGVEYAGIKLVSTGRDCIYDHSFDIWQFGYENDYNAIIQCAELYRRGFPEHYGLNENNVIYRRHTERMHEVDDEWWWWITHYSFRDQFSFMYCLWKFN